MLNWLKDTTFGELQRWLSEKITRTYQKLHTERLRERAKILPPELRGINQVLATLNNNSWAVHHLFKKARSKKQYANALLYYFYSFELTLKHLIISEMNLKNMEGTLTGTNRLNFFSTYSEKEMVEILDLGPMGKVIEKFLELFPKYNHRSDLWKINSERNDIVHNMLKKEMSEADIEQSFEEFFSKTATALKNTLQEFDAIFEKRPANFLNNLTQILESKTQTEMGQ